VKNKVSAMIFGGKLGSKNEKPKIYRKNQQNIGNI